MLHKQGYLLWNAGMSACLECGLCDSAGRGHQQDALYSSVLSSSASRRARLAGFLVDPWLIGCLIWYRIDHNTTKYSSYTIRGFTIVHKERDLTTSVVAIG